MLMFEQLYETSLLILASVPWRGHHPEKLKNRAYRTVILTVFVGANV